MTKMILVGTNNGDKFQRLDCATGVEEKSRRSDKLHMLSHRNMMRVMFVRFFDLGPMD